MWIIALSVGKLYPGETYDSAMTCLELLPDLSSHLPASALLTDPHVDIIGKVSAFLLVYYTLLQRPIYV